MSTVVSFENPWRTFEHRSGNLVHSLPRCEFPRDAAVRTGPEAVGVFKILAQPGMAEEEATTV